MHCITNIFMSTWIILKNIFRMDPNPFLRHSFWTVTIGMTVSWLFQLGVHPGSVQRFIALPTYRKAQKSLIYFVIGVDAVQIFCGVIGMLVYAKYKDCDPISAGVCIHDVLKNFNASLKKLIFSLSQTIKAYCPFM